MVLIEFECHWSQNGKAIRENIVESEMRYASKGVGDEAADQEGHNDQEYASVTVVCQNIQIQNKEKHCDRDRDYRFLWKL